MELGNPAFMRGSELLLCGLSTFLLCDMINVFNVSNSIRDFTISISYKKMWISSLFLVIIRKAYR